MKRCQGCGAKFVLHRKKKSCLLTLFQFAAMCGIGYWIYLKLPSAAPSPSSAPTAPAVKIIPATPTPVATDPLPINTNAAARLHYAEILNADRQYVALRGDVIEKEAKLEEARKNPDINRRVVRSSDFNLARAKLADYLKAAATNPSMKEAAFAAGK